MSAGVLPETVVAESRLPEGLTGRPESSTSVMARQDATVGEAELLQTRMAWAWGETAAAEVTVALTIPRVAAATSATDARGVRIEQLLGGERTDTAVGLRGASRRARRRLKGLGGIRAQI